MLYLWFQSATYPALPKFIRHFTPHQHETLPILIGLTIVVFLWGYFRQKNKQ